MAGERARVAPREERCCGQGCKGCTARWVELELGTLRGLRCTRTLLVFFVTPQQEKE